jgi:acyl dehydratase
VAVPILDLEIPDGSYALTAERHARVLEYVHASELFSSDAGAPAHPVFAHLANQCGMGWTFDQFLDAIDASAADGVVIGGGVLDFNRPIVVGVGYTVRSRIIGVERKHGRRLGPFEAITLALDLVDGSDVVVTMTETYIVPRLGGVEPTPSDESDPLPATAERGDPLDPISRTDIIGLADVMGDTNPIHRDAAVAAASGFRGIVNQAPANLAYILNAMARHRGELSDLRRASFGFQDAVVEGDQVEVRLSQPAPDVIDGELLIVGTGAAAVCHAEFDPAR